MMTNVHNVVCNLSDCEEPVKSPNTVLKTAESYFSC